MIAKYALILCLTLLVTLTGTLWRTASAAVASADSTSSIQHSPRVGLALSGGGAKGFAHIGALKVIEKAGIKIDYITGTSMGSIVGALYAIGYSVEEIEAIALGTDWSDLFSDRIVRRERSIEQKLTDDRYFISLPIIGHGIVLPRGLVAGQKISALLDRLTLSSHACEDFSRFPIPFACVATDIVTGEPVVLNHGSLSEAIRASMAIPSAFTPVEIEDRMLVDGMLGRNFPVQDVIAMGANVVIGVDVGKPLAARDHLNNFMQILGQAIGFIGADTNGQQRSLCSVLITPDLKGVTSLDFSRMEDIIAAGEAAAQSMLPELIALNAQLDTTVRLEAAPRPPDPDIFLVHDISVDGLRNIESRVVLSISKLNAPTQLSMADIERGVARIYSVGMFERVTYRLEQLPEGLRLHIVVIEKADDFFRFGLRYDSRNRLMAIFNVLYRNKLGRSSLFNFDFLVGEQNQLFAQHFIHIMPTWGLSLSSSAGYHDMEIDVYDGNNRTSRLTMTAIYGEFIAGKAFSDCGFLGGGFRSEWVDLESDLYDSGMPSYRENVKALVGVVGYDTLDRTYFPRHGIALYSRHEYSMGALGSENSFSRHFVDVKVYAPISQRVTLFSEIAGGTSTSDDLPPQYQFTIGGVDTPALLIDRESTRISFLGLRHQQLLGYHFQFVQVGTQLQFGSNVMLLLRANAGNTSDEWDIDLSRNSFKTGAGATLGLITPFGPIEVTGSYGSAGDLLGYLNVGMKF